MKRIAIVWSELTQLRVPAALTLNARTEYDWDRWTQFVLERPEVLAVAVELGTGGRYAERREFIFERLRALGAASQGRLKLFLRGGRAHAENLSGAFRSVHVIDTNSFMKTVHRQRVVAGPNGLASRASFTLIDQPIDDLLQSNVQASQRTLAPDASKAL